MGPDVTLINSGIAVAGVVKDILEKDEAYGSHPAKGIRVNVEHTSTNPTGPIHVGRARNPIIGDTLARCFKMCGYDTSTEYYVNDVGKQVVILTWGVNNLTEDQVRVYLHRARISLRDQYLRQQ